MLSLIARIDFVPLVSQTHKSSGFIKFLKILDAKYLECDTIQLILDNRSALISKNMC